MDDKSQLRVEIFLNVELVVSSSPVFGFTESLGQGDHRCSYAKRYNCGVTNPVTTVINSG